MQTFNHLFQTADAKPTDLKQALLFFSALPSATKYARIGPLIREQCLDTNDVRLKFCLSLFEPFEFSMKNVKRPSLVLDIALLTILGVRTAPGHRPGGRFDSSLITELLMPNVSGTPLLEMSKSWFQGLLELGQIYGSDVPLATIIKPQTENEQVKAFYNLKQQLQWSLLGQARSPTHIRQFSTYLHVDRTSRRWQLASWDATMLLQVAWSTMPSAPAPTFRSAAHSLFDKLAAYYSPEEQKVLFAMSGVDYAHLLELTLHPKITESDITRWLVDEQKPIGAGADPLAETRIGELDSLSNYYAKRMPELTTHVFRCMRLYLRTPNSKMSTALTHVCAPMWALQLAFLRAVASTDTSLRPYVDNVNCVARAFDSAARCANDLRDVSVLAYQHCELVFWLDYLRWQLRHNHYSIPLPAEPVVTADKIVNSNLASKFT